MGVAAGTYSSLFCQLTLASADALGLAEIRMTPAVGLALLLLLGVIDGDVDSDGRAAMGGVVGSIVFSGCGGRMTMGGHTAVGRIVVGFDFAGGDDGDFVVVAGAGVSGGAAWVGCVVGVVVAAALALADALVDGCVVRGAGAVDGGCVVVSAGDGSTDA